MNSRKATVLLTTMSLLILPLFAHAATITVNILDDVINTTDGQCSLREAVIAANKNTVSGTVAGECAAGAATETDIVSLAQAGTYALAIGGSGEDAAATGDLDITEKVTIVGPLTGIATIAGGTTTADGTFLPLGDRLFEIVQLPQADVVTLARLTLQNGSATGNGGAIRTVGAGMLNILNANVQGNTATGNGGGIANDGIGTVQLDRVTLTSNIASGGWGGAVANNTGTIIITGTPIVTHGCTLAYNKAAAGGAIATWGGTVQILKSAIFDNETFDFKLSTPFVPGNPGGAILNVVGKVYIINSTLNHNKARTGGGGIAQTHMNGAIYLWNSTITNNQLPGDFITKPTGGGINNTAWGTVEIGNSILAQNYAIAGGSECSGGVTSKGHNLFGGKAATGCGVTVQATDTVTDTIGLGAFVNNDQYTGPGSAYLPLTANSPAINNGDAAICVAKASIGGLTFNLERDQLAVSRVAACDIGAIESSGFCGDGVTQSNLLEECDGGSQCGADCKWIPAVCGNGAVEQGEICDSADPKTQSGCYNNCKSYALCGNGVLEAGGGEVCDPGSQKNCNTDCHSFALCGNGLKEAGEVCDGEATCNNCQSISLCGNGIKEAGEVCDGEAPCNNCASISMCGDGAVTAGEICDTTDPATKDGCSADCKTMALCGNGIVESGEMCDTADPKTQSGCAANCKTMAICGNGVREVGEICDTADPATKDGCSADCKTVAQCGNGIVEAGEICDTADPKTAKDCNTGCKSIGAAPVCGNGIVEFGEECDNGAANSNTLPGACRTNCQKAHCGDNVVDVSVGEVCDDGDIVDGDGCRGDCKKIETCGDGIVDKNEACDAGGKETAACTASCVAPSCGDGIAQLALGEECDAGIGNSDTAPNACRTICRKPRCGDHVADLGETCDDGNALGGDGCGNTCKMEGATQPSGSGTPPPPPTGGGTVTPPSGDGTNAAPTISGTGQQPVLALPATGEGNGGASRGSADTLGAPDRAPGSERGAPSSGGCSLILP